MSTARAVEAVTLTLRSLLTGVTANVTARAPDRAQENIQTEQLNLFLYEIVANPALRNLERPEQTRGGAGLHVPLTLDLRYLLTAYAHSDDDEGAHRLLGEAMLVLHDGAVLARALLEGVLAEAGVQLQPERVRLTPLQLSVEDLSKLWTAFQVNYRLSVAYQASVVLIESAIPAPSPLPVLRRGRQAVDHLGRDQGARVLARGGPLVDRVWVEVWGDPSFPARTGDRIVLEGSRLTGGAVSVAFRRRDRDEIVVAADADSTADKVFVALPANVPAGFSTVTAAIDQGTDPPLVSNTMAVPVASRITAVQKAPPGAGTVEVTVTCDRVLVDDEAVVLIVGDRQVAPKDPVVAGAPLAFAIAVPPAPEVATLRVRVEGVDSIPLADPVPEGPRPTDFDPAQQVNLP